MTFGDIDRPVIVCGLSCADRLDALQRIMEHEIIHLFELLSWGRSSCSARRFREMANRTFGHNGVTHDLVTPRERAAVQHGIRVGNLVEFKLEGLRRVGFRTASITELPCWCRQGMEQGIPMESGTRSIMCRFRVVYPQGESNPCMQTENLPS